MLSPPDAEFARRDPALPGLATLLDPDAFAAALRAALPAANVGAARATYVRYKPRTNCLVAYRLAVDGTEIDLYAKAHRPEAGAELDKARQYPGAPSLLGPGNIILDDPAIAVYVFPNDSELTVLARLADERARLPLLAKVFPDRPELWQGTLRCLRYKPARRYVAQLTAESGQQALLKVFARGEYYPASYAAKKFQSCGPLRLARRVGRSGRHRLLALEWLPGQPLHQAVRHPRFELNAAGAAGAALAGLHAQAPRRLRRLSREAEAVTLLSAAVGVAAVCPHLAERAYNLATRLTVDLLNAPRLTYPVHGDFSADQVLLTNGNVAILDLDGAVQGDPAADLGSFAAQLERDALFGHLPPDRVEPLTTELLAGYRLQTGRDLPARIGLYTAAGLLRLAPEPFRNREPGWPERTEAVLARAEAICKMIPPGNGE